MNSFNFDHLTSVEFEEFWYDLIELEGFKNLSWRIGTGLGTNTTSDKGRDIEAQITLEHIGGITNQAKWFFECKHQKKGIPPTELASAITWATVERPYALVFVASNHFSNPAKEYIEKHIENHSPGFYIYMFEKKDLARISGKHPLLLEKYKISPPEREEIKINVDLYNCDDKNLAGFMKAIMRIAEHSHVRFQTIQESKNRRIFCVDVPIKYKDILLVELEQLKEVHTGDYGKSESISANFELHKVTSMNISYQNVKFGEMDVFTPFIIDISSK